MDIDATQSPIRVLSGSLGIGIGVGCGVGVGLRAAAVSSFNANMPTVPLPSLPPQLVQRMPWLNQLRAGCGVGVRGGSWQCNRTVHTRVFVQVGYGFGWGIGIPQHTLARLLPTWARRKGVAGAPYEHNSVEAPSHATLAQQERDVLRERLALAEDKLATVTGLYCAVVPDDARWCGSGR